MNSLRKLTAPAFLAALAITFSGCASMPAENPRLAQLDDKLKTAYGDKYVAEYGLADLTKAGASLAAARVAWRAGRKDETQHEMAMTENHLVLGGIHGEQERVKAETVALKDRFDQIRLASRDAALRDANEKVEIYKSDAVIASAAIQNAQAAAQTAEDKNRVDAVAATAAIQNAQAATQSAEDKIAAMKLQLSVYDLKVTAMGATLVLHDVMFDTDSAQLRSGSVDRLEPLISYLRASPATTVRIEGHTDDTGSVQHNNELSLERANSVKRALMVSSTVTNSIDTFGSGQTKPVATNATASGREQNRRVEITLR